jgi:hypothetical protein
MNIMDRENEYLFETVLEMNNRALGLVLGIITGLSIFVATLWLVIKSGAVVGPHLALLSQFFPGYSVTFFGSLVGLVYGFIVGFLVGWSIACLYTRFVHLRNR